jgi:hypothetical protein
MNKEEEEEKERREEEEEENNHPLNSHPKFTTGDLFIHPLDLNLWTVLLAIYSILPSCIKQTTKEEESSGLKKVKIVGQFKVVCFTEPKHLSAS